MRTGLKVNVVSVINNTIISVLDRILLMAVCLYHSASEPTSCLTNAVVVHLSRRLFTGRNLPTLPYPTSIWCPIWGEPVEISKIFVIRKLESLGYTHPTYYVSYFPKK